MDSECAAGLTCGMRNTGELTPVFGCSGLGIAGLDYCYDASAFNSAANTLTGGDTDAPVVPNTSVPNTVAPNTVAPNTDTNENANPSTITTPDQDANNLNGNYVGEAGDFSSNDRTTLTTRNNPCSATDQCELCEGDCMGDDTKCSGDMTCFQRPNGDLTRVLGCQGVGEAGTDYCWRPVANTLVLRTRPCNSNLPCGKCEGSCNGNEQCAEGLACYRRVDLSIVPGCSGNGFSGNSFCWDPTDLQGTRHLLRH